MTPIKFMLNLAVAFFVASFATILVAVDDTGAQGVTKLSGTSLDLVRGLNLNNFQGSPTDCSEYVNAPGYVPDFLCAGNQGSKCVTCKDPQSPTMIPFGGGQNVQQGANHNCLYSNYYYGTCNAAGGCNIPQPPTSQGQCSGTIALWPNEPQ